MPHILISTTSDDREELVKIAGRLIDDQLAACCQITGPVTSFYRWRGIVATSIEWMCLIKTQTKLYSSVEQVIRQHHHYDEPEIIATEIKLGSAGYLNWIDENVR